MIREREVRSCRNDGGIDGSTGRLFTRILTSLCCFVVSVGVGRANVGNDDGVVAVEDSVTVTVIYVFVFYAVVIDVDVVLVVLVVHVVLVVLVVLFVLLVVAVLFEDLLLV